MHLAACALPTRHLDLTPASGCPQQSLVLGSIYPSRSSRVSRADAQRLLPPLHPSLPFLGGTLCVKRLFSLLQFSPSIPRFVVTSNLRDLQILVWHQAELWQERGRVLFLTHSRPGGGLPQGKWGWPTAFLPCPYPGSRTTWSHSVLCTSFWGGVGKVVSDFSPVSPKLFLRYHYPKQ